MTHEELEQQCLVSLVIDEVLDLWSYVGNGLLLVNEEGKRIKADMDWLRGLLETRLVDETHLYVGKAALDKALEESEDEFIMGYEG